MDAQNRLDRAMRGDRGALKMSVDTQSFEAGIDAMLSGLEQSVRPAAQAGAQVIYDRVQANVAGIGKVTGNLAGAIYQAWSQDKSGQFLQTYHVSYRTKGGGGPRAPHGHLVEFGHIQRYVVRQRRDGSWYTAIRPEMRGKPKPNRRASQAEKDAYYIPLPAGPKQVKAQPFIRPAVVVYPQALEAMKQRWYDELRARGFK